MIQSLPALYPARANTIFANLPVTYHVTDYLNAILNYSAFGTAYYTELVNELMALGYEAGGWEYRVGVHQTNLLLRSHFDEGHISVNWKTWNPQHYTAASAITSSMAVGFAKQGHTAMNPNSDENHMSYGNERQSFSPTQIRKDFYRLQCRITE